jgi:dihydrofolate reductase
MRKIIARIATSADGFIARPDGGVEWLNERPKPRGLYGMGEFYRSIDTIFWGRKTYDILLEFQKKGVKRAALDPNVKNYVFSRNPPQRPVAGVEFISGPITRFARHLRAEPGKQIWMMGGADLIASFLDAGEIDEFSINVVPVMIGEGIPLIAPKHRHVPLRLLSTHKFPDGVVHLHYAVRPNRHRSADAQQ